jgi:predicted chitinase
MMDREKFFAKLRNSSLFPTGLSSPQVMGIEAILDSCVRQRVSSGHHVAHILANVYHESGRYMLGIKETVMQSHSDKNPPDEVVKNRLDIAWAGNKLPWVKVPYWREGWFGRGPIQITHKANYEKMGKRLGVDLVRKPHLALDPRIGADIAVVGMMEGLFTGKKLAQYSFPSALDAAPADHPRRIVNGQDGTDAKIAKYHRVFFEAIEAAGGWILDRRKPPLKEIVTTTVGTGGSIAVAKEQGMGWTEAFGIAFAVAVIIIVGFIIYSKVRK